MNSITQIYIFDFSKIRNLGDLESLNIFFKNIEDNELCETIEKRKCGRKANFNICCNVIKAKNHIKNIEKRQTKKTKKYFKISIDKNENKYYNIIC